MGQGDDRLRGLPQAHDADEPTLGEIKRALHDLSRTTADAATRDTGAALREAHQLLRSLAVHNGIDPDYAVRQQLAAVELLRQRMFLASAGGGSFRE